MGFSKKDCRLSKILWEKLWENHRKCDKNRRKWDTSNFRDTTHFRHKPIELLHLSEKTIHYPSLWNNPLNFKVFQEKNVDYHKFSGRNVRKIFANRIRQILPRKLVKTKLIFKNSDYKQGIHWLDFIHPLMDKLIKYRKYSHVVIKHKKKSYDFRHLNVILLEYIKHRTQKVS